MMMAKTGAPAVEGRSPLVGAAMTPTGIAKTIHEPVETTTGFSFMNGGSKKKDDTFSFVKDAMKNS